MESNVRSFDVELCFRQSYEVYRSNYLAFILGSLVVNVLGVCSLGIFMGPLSAGLFMMILKRLRTSDMPKFDEIFNYFNRFGRLLLLFFIVGICSFLGFLILIVPAVLICTIWMYSFLISCDKDVQSSDALTQSYKLVTTNVFWKHVVLIVIIFSLVAMTVAIPYLGVALYVALLPLVLGLIASSYHQLVDENVEKAAPAVIA